MDNSQESVSIIIKAPNQKIDDLVIHCNPNWTIHELKNYLSQVYPSKPPSNGQKLIYSGKLLPDTAVVNDVLRSYNGQQNNTVHLVCSYAKEELLSGLKTDSESSKDVKNSTPDNINTPRLPNMPELSGVREYKPNFSRDLENYERAYLMYTYMQYLMHHTQRRIGDQNDMDNTSMPETNPDENINQINPPVNNGNVNADDDRQANRDWLDWVYILSRVGVIFTLVYFYSSPLRCIMVTAMALILYHLGMFRWRPLEVNNILNNVNNLNNNNNIGNEEENAVGDVNPDLSNRVGFLQLNPRFGWIKVIFNFVISFLLSLVPDNRE